MKNSHISRFYEKTIDERRSIVKTFAHLTEQEMSLLEQSRSYLPIGNRFYQ